MPIEFSDIGEDDKWAGSDWTVTDPDDLAHHIARVALGQYRHVAKIREWAKPGGLRVLRAASTISETLVWANAAG